MRRYACLLMAALLLAACSPKAHDAAPAGALPDIWPDYVGVTVPATIAPLDFTLPGAQALDVQISAPDGTVLRSAGKTATCFPEKRWKSLLQRSVGDALRVSVSGQFDGKWRSFDPFAISVFADVFDF